MMQLYSPSISAQGVTKINYNIDNFDYFFNKTEFRKMMIEDGFGSTWSPNEMFQKFKKISTIKGNGELW